MARCPRPSRQTPRSTAARGSWTRLRRWQPRPLSLAALRVQQSLTRRSIRCRAAPSPVLWIGAGGLAQALAGDERAEAVSPLPLPILGLFGSDQAVTAGQLAACGPDWLLLPDGNEVSATMLAEHLENNGRALA